MQTPQLPLGSLGLMGLRYKHDRSTQNLCSLTVQKSEPGGVLIRATLNPLPQTWLKSIRDSLASGGNELPKPAKALLRRIAGTMCDDLADPVRKKGYTRQ